MKQGMKHIMKRPIKTCNGKNEKHPRPMCYIHGTVRIVTDTSVCPKALKDGPDLLDLDLRIFTCCQSNAMSKLIVFVNPGEVEMP
jgi:hypothetical protein